MRNFLSTLAGGLIALVVSWWFYRKQQSDARQEVARVSAKAWQAAEKSARFLEALADGGGGVRFGRDQHGVVRFEVLHRDWTGEARADGVTTATATGTVTPARDAGVGQELENASQ
jgi:hypothetical protein